MCWEIGAAKVSGSAEEDGMGRHQIKAMLLFIQAMLPFAALVFIEQDFHRGAVATDCRNSS